MFVIIWEYHIRETYRKDFEVLYSANGAWAELFKRSEGYMGTELLQAESNSGEYITIDRWESKEAFDLFKSRWHAEYELLDKQSEGLTELEKLLGRWKSK